MLSSWRWTRLGPAYAFHSVASADEDEDEDEIARQRSDVESAGQAKFKGPPPSSLLQQAAGATATRSRLSRYAPLVLLFGITLVGVALIGQAAWWLFHAEGGWEDAAFGGRATPVDLPFEFPDDASTSSLSPSASVAALHGLMADSVRGPVGTEWAMRSGLNSTLGFERIFALNMAQRPNKRDELSLMASVTGLDLTFAPGMAVSGSELDRLGKPLHRDRPGPGEIGSWRSHANAWRKMLEDDVETALILEDDADWDVDVRTSLVATQRPFATLLSAVRRDGARRTPTLQSPWQSPRDWDVLYFGSCLEEPFGNSSKAGDAPVVLHSGRNVDPDKPPYVVYPDESVPGRAETHKVVQDFYAAYGVAQPEDDEGGEGKQATPEGNGAQAATSGGNNGGGGEADGGQAGVGAQSDRDDVATQSPAPSRPGQPTAARRILPGSLERRNAESLPARRSRRRFVMRANFPVCTLAYAVTKRGARRLLYHTSRHIDLPLDVSMASLSQQGRLEAYEVWPPVMTQWKIAGAEELNSDVKVEDDFAHEDATPKDDAKVEADNDGGANAESGPEDEKEKADDGADQDYHNHGGDSDHSGEAREAGQGDGEKDQEEWHREQHSAAIVQDEAGGDSTHDRAEPKTIHTDQKASHQAENPLQDASIGAGHGVQLRNSVRRALRKMIEEDVVVEYG